MQNQIKINYFVIFYISIFISSIDSLQAEDVDNKEFCSASKIDDNRCASHTYQVVKPLLDYFRKVQNNHDNHESKDSVIRELQAKVAEITLQNEQKDKLIDVYKQLYLSNTAQIDLLSENILHLRKTCESTNHNSDQLTELNQTIAVYAETINKQNTQIVKLQAQVKSDSLKLFHLEDQLENSSDLIREKDELTTKQQSQLQNITNILNNTQVELKACKNPNLEGEVDSCKPFATSPGIHKIKVPGMDPFNVLCQSSATGPGWIVIQQRINGKEDFYRDWDTYKAGFGSFDGDFFLGLEKIHQLTKSQRHKLYIHLERFNGEFTYATYDHFAIAGVDHQYQLIKVDGFSGNTTDSRDYMNYQKTNNFFTFDRDNKYGCARKRHAGYWFSNCASSNLNGKYFDHEVTNRTSVTWNAWSYSLKKVQMLIRP